MLGAWAFTTHQVLSPSDRVVIAACAQVGCLSYRHGWDSLIDESTDLGRRQAAAIRSGRHRRTYRELPRTGGQGPTVFRFDPGQRCFAEHRTRQELFVVRKGSPSTALQPLRASRQLPARAWVDDMHETVDRRLTSIKRG